MRWVCFFIALLGLGSPLQAAGKRYIVSIGINQYSDPTWNSLQFAGKDAADVFHHFEKWYDGGWMVTDGGENGQAAKPVRTEDIRAALNRLALANTDETDTIIIYISSHGSIGRRLNPLTKAFELEKIIVTNDTRADAPTETGFGHSELMDYFRSLKSRRKALILDSCYSGTGKSKLNARMLSLLSKQKSRFFDAPAEDPGEGSILLAASAWGEEAREYSDGKNGLYTYFLLQGFEQGLKRGEAVTLTEAHAFAAQAVKSYTQGVQNPTAIIEMVGTDPILVKGQTNGAKNPIIYAFDWTAKRLHVLVDGVDKGSMEKGVLEIPEGLRHITIIEPEKKLVLSDRRLVLSQNQEYALSHFLNFHPRYSVGLVTTYGQSFDAKTRQILGDRGFVLNGLEGTTYDVAGRLDLSLIIAGNSEVRSHFDSESVVITQKFSYLTAQVSGGKRWLINRLSDFGDSKGQETFLTLKAGLTGVHIVRHIESPEFNDPRQVNQRLGLHAGLELKTLFHDSQVQVGGFLQAAAIPDLAAEGQTSLRWDLGLAISRAY